VAKAVTFHDLLSHEPNLPLADRYRRAVAQLPHRVRRSGLEWWRDRTGPHGPGRLLLVGVAVWSDYDLHLLDLMNEAIAARNQPDLTVAIFNIDELASQEEFGRIFPGIGEVLQPPVVGCWADGRLRDKAYGFEARRLVARLLGFDTSLILEPPAAVTG
jgi:hypothetical protein